MPAPTPFAPARSIDDVLQRLDAIIDQALLDRSPVGYFAALYRTVTAEVKRGIAAGRFDDGPRMERLDVVFANRYLDAFDTWRRGGRPSQCWKVALGASTDHNIVILQHLLLGMNAHINLDLAIAAAEVCPGSAISGLERDFHEINRVLADLEGEVEHDVRTLSPWIDRLDAIDPKAGRVVANFSIDRARDASWLVAQQLAHLDGDLRTAAIATIDANIAALGQLIAHPVGFIANANLTLVRLRETHDVRKVIETLRTSSAVAAPADALRPSAPGATFPPRA